jgi:hypothetical protein
VGGEATGLGRPVPHRSNNGGGIASAAATAIRGATGSGNDQKEVVMKNQKRQSNPKELGPFMTLVLTFAAPQASAGNAIEVWFAGVVHGDSSSSTHNQALYDEPDAVRYSELNPPRLRLCRSSS